MLGISNVNDVFINNAKDLDIDMSMYNVLEKNCNHSMTPDCLWNY